MEFFKSLRAREDRKFWVFAAWLFAVFLMGGSSRDDIASLVILRPISAMMLAAAAYKIAADDLKPYRSLLAILAAIIGLVAAHLIPLPPAIWQALPQRELIADIDDVARVGSVWRPLSIDPARTWNALFSLMVPLATVLLAIRLDRTQLKRTVSIVLAIGLLSVVLGILQVVGGVSGLYFYAIHNAGAAVGLFANRNHQGAFLASLLPLLAVIASGGVPHRDKRGLLTILAAAAGLVLVPVLLITGSRAGLVLGFFGLASAVLVYRRAKAIPAVGAPKRARSVLLSQKRLLYVGLGLTAILLASATVFLSRAESLRRLLASTKSEELRVAAFEPVTQLALNYMPFGSGAGTFVEAFFRIEPRSFLSPTYFNHAHFDFLEWIVTGGIPAMLILVAVLFFVAHKGFRLFIRSSIDDPGVQLGRAGLIVCLLFAVASVVDYPLRTPALSAFLALVAVWVWSAGAVAKKGPQIA